MATSSSSSEDEFLAVKRRLPTFRPRVDWGTLSKADFVERFRMTPTQAEKLLHIIGEDLEPIRYTNHALSPKEKFCGAMRFFGTNAPYFDVGDSEHYSKATVYRCVFTVIKSVLSKLNNVQWPENEEDCRQIAIAFFNKSKGFPKCAGAIDGSLIPILAPSVDEPQFVDRKGHHSINAMGVCGPDLRFYSVSVKFPGSVNDARVFRRSGLAKKFDEGYRPFPGAVIVADAAYPQNDYIVPNRNFGGEWEPFFELLISDNHFISIKLRAQERCRASIENAWALFKNKFACLKGPLRFKNATDSAKCIKALAFLHNFLIENKEDDEHFETDDEDDNGEQEVNEEENLNLVANDHMRNLLQIFKNANNL